MKLPSQTRSFSSTVTSWSLLFLFFIIPSNSHAFTVQRWLGQTVKKAITIAPLASTRYIVPETQPLGGSGAKFIVTWSSKEGLTQPIIEGIMIGTKMQQGISFVTNSQILSGKKTP